MFHLVTVRVVPRPASTFALLPSADEPVPLLLANTVWADRAGVHDALTTTAQLAAWLATVGPRLFDDAGRSYGTVRRSDVETAVQLRAAIRTLAARLTRDPRRRADAAMLGMSAAEATRALNAAAAEAVPVPQLSFPRPRALVRPPDGVRLPVAALAAVASVSVPLLAPPYADDLRACLAPGCVLYFVKDHPRREWCSASCGNRVRAARHYRLHRG